MHRGLRQTRDSVVDDGLRVVHQAPGDAEEHQRRGDQDEAQHHAHPVVAELSRRRGWPAGPPRPERPGSGARAAGPGSDPGSGKNMLTSISAPQITSTAPKVKVPTRRSRAGRDSGVCSGLFIAVRPPLPPGRSTAAERSDAASSVRGLRRIGGASPGGAGGRRREGGDVVVNGRLVLGAPDEPQAQQDHQHGDDQAGQAIAQQSV